MDTRYFQEISGNFKWNIDFAIYKRGETQITGVSYYAFFTVRSVTCELDLEAGEYIIFVSPPNYLNLNLLAIIIIIIIINMNL